MYILDNEIKETIPATIEEGYIVFETTHLSEYGIIATEKNNIIRNPQTEDNIRFYIVIFILSVIGIVVLKLYGYKRKQIN